MKTLHLPSGIDCPLIDMRRERVKVGKTHRQGVEVVFRGTVQQGRLLTDGCPWAVTYDDGSTEDYTHIYPIAGAITDYRDGTVSVLMAGETEEQRLTAIIEALTGDERTTKAQAEQRRAATALCFAMATAEMDNDDTIACSILADEWQAGGNYKAGRIVRADGYPYKCRQDVDCAVFTDVFPGSDAWPTFFVPFHATKPETALPYLKPRNAEELYQPGEYMVWTDGTTQRCVKPTDHSPDEQLDAWETHKED